jgi:hypothetical protein
VFRQEHCSNGGNLNKVSVQFSVVVGNERTVGETGGSLKKCSSPRLPINCLMTLLLFQTLDLPFITCIFSLHLYINVLCFTDDLLLLIQQQMLVTIKLRFTLDFQITKLRAYYSAIKILEIRWWHTKMVSGGSGPSAQMEPGKSSRR